MSAYLDGLHAGQLGLTKISPHVSAEFLAGYKSATMNYDNPQEVRAWAADLTELWPRGEEADAIIAILEKGENK